MYAKDFLKRGGSKKQLEKILNHCFITPRTSADFKEALIEIGVLKSKSKASLRVTTCEITRRMEDGRMIKYKRMNFINGRGTYLNTMYLTTEDYRLLDEVENE